MHGRGVAGWPGVNASADEYRCACVTQIVDPEGWRQASTQEARPPYRLSEAFDTKGVTTDAFVDERIGRWSDGLEVRAEFLDEEAGTAMVRMRFDFVSPQTNSSDLRNGLRDDDPSRFEIDTLPLQSRRLAPAKTVSISFPSTSCSKCDSVRPATSRLQPDPCWCAHDVRRGRRPRSSVHPGDHTAVHSPDSM
jgi:hypothetical protein